MSDQTVISVENLGKTYRLSHQGEGRRYEALRDVIADKFRNLCRPRRPSTRVAATTEDFWALKDISFEVRQGEVIGIIGRNGAGKSTLLKILSRITEPTEGRVRIRGRVASLLEVGTGFHPELTGRENIYLNGAILGMSRAEIRRKFDEIVAFAEVEKFLDTPVKRYSSGMYVRLAFAVAAHLEPEILVVDEVLAVGDAQFQKKCLGKMQDVAKGGRTVLFVSHNMNAARTLCSRAILLNRGKVESAGEVDTVVGLYLERTGNRDSSKWESPPGRVTTGPMYFLGVQAKLEGQQPTLKLICIVRLKCMGDSSPKAFIAIDIRDAMGTPLMQAVPISRPFLETIDGIYSINIEVDLPPLIPGRYWIDMWVGSHFTSTIDYIREVVAFAVDDGPTPERSFPFSLDHGYMVPPSKCTFSREPVI
jgi:lipopolysaccharide transport system ATP-binding protein